MEVAKIREMSKPDADIADRHYWETVDGVRTLRALPEFTEDEVNICLEEAATIRRSYLGVNLERFENEEGGIPYAERYKDEATLDALAAKLARLAGIELELDCSDCDGTGEKWGHPCQACLGTGVWPPRIAKDVNFE